MPDRSPVMTADVLVLGAGLAGLRAAIAAAEESPGAEVVCVALRDGPTGSSFANHNGFLGMQVCLSDQEREDFAAEALAVASPGFADPALVSLQAEESEARFRDFLDWGMPLPPARDSGDAEPSGNSALPNALSDLTLLHRQPGCFSPGRPRAFVLQPLPDLHLILHDRAERLGVRFLTGLNVIHLPVAGGRCLGAVLHPLLRHSDSACAFDPQAAHGLPPLLPSAGDGSPAHPLRFAARMTIAALGGPASLFLHCQSGPAVSGHAYALLRNAGAEMINTPFLQFMWTDADSGRFISPAVLAHPEARIEAHGKSIPLPPELRALAAIRSTHCPTAYDYPSTPLDAFLLSHLDERSELTAIIPGQSPVRLVPSAHAGNGGARIDRHGRTNIPGLYAAGECASGMHGANRIGGAMVTATQVFGQRAGRHAARSLDTAPPPDTAALLETTPGKAQDEALDARARIAHLLQISALRRIAPSRPDVSEELEEILPQRLTAESRLAVETALQLL